MTNFKRYRETIAGPVFSILTPFDATTDEIAFDTLEAYLNRIYDAGGRQFYVMAYNSRFSQLTFDEILQLNEFVTKTVKSLDPANTVIVADPPHCSTKVSIDFARHAADVGADIISLIIRERYYSDDQIIQHYRMVSDNSDIGLLVHEMPFLNGLGGPPIGWSVDLIDRVVDIDHVCAIKEDAKDDQFTRDVVRKIKDRVAVIVSGGGKRQWLKVAEEGCQAWLNGIGVFEPKLATVFWNAYQSGDREMLDRIIDEIEIPFFEKAVQVFGWHLAIKSALECRGIMNRHDRMPLMPLNDSNHATIANLMDRLPIDTISSALSTRI